MPPAGANRPAASAERELPVTSTTAATLAEIRSVMAELPGPNTVAGDAAASREAVLTKPPERSGGSRS